LCPRRRWPCLPHGRKHYARIVPGTLPLSTERKLQAQRRVYRLRPEPLAQIDEWLGRYRALWEQRLDALHTEVARGKSE
jgi:hypothetical protein